MLIQKFWGKKVLLIGAMVLLVTLFSIDLGSLLKGSPEFSKAQAAYKLTIIRGKVVTKKDPSSGKVYYDCEPTGFSCAIIYINDMAPVLIRFPWSSD